MFSGDSAIFCFLLLIAHIVGLVKLPKVDDNNILATEAAIRDTVNTLFSSLRHKDFKKNPRLKEYSTVHNQLISFTLQDYRNLKEIAKLIKVVKNNTNVDIDNFMAALNELLNEDSTEKKELTFNSKEEMLVDYIEEFLRKLEVLKKEYNTKHDDVRLKKDIYKIFKKGNIFPSNYSYQEERRNVTVDKNILLEDEGFWKPEQTQSGRRIFQGTRTKIKHFPFVASIQVFNTFHCGGSIISADLIITAASCLQLAYNNRLFRENPAFLSVRVGSNYYNGGDDIPALEVYFHPEYNPKFLWNNICLIRLVRKLKFSRRRRKVKKIDFDRQASLLPEVTDGITIVGWGAQGNSNNVLNPWRNVLAFSVLDIYPLKECQEVYSKEYVTKKHFCGGYFSKGGGACNRDVGGPGVVNGILAGVVSFGSPVCGSSDAPTVFTKLGHYTDWIETIMEQEVPQRYARTTTFGDRLLTIGHLHDPRLTTFKIEPPYGNFYPISIKTIDSLRILNSSDLFKQFLATMFDSKERSQFEDVLKPMNYYEQSAETTPLPKTTSRKLPHLVQSVTPIMHEIPASLFDYDSKMLDSEELNPFTPPPHVTSEIKKFKIQSVKPIPTSTDLQIIPELDDFDIKYTTVKPDQNGSNEIEDDLLKILDNIDVNKLIDNISNSDDDKLVADPKDLEMFEDEDREKKFSNIDESILTLLYLSDTDKDPYKNNKGKNKIDLVDKEAEDDGMSIPSEGISSFKDLTYRNNNSAMIYDFLPESELYNLMSNNMQFSNKRV